MMNATPTDAPAGVSPKGPHAFLTARRGKGTLEWSDKSYPSCWGCQHGCHDGYARSQAARRDARVRLPGAGRQQTLDPNRARRGAEAGPYGVVMVSTSHDLVPDSLLRSLATLTNLTRPNRVLLVNKPHLGGIQPICQDFSDRQQLRFRITIGPLDPARCAFWKPGALPVPQKDRISRPCSELPPARGWRRRPGEEAS